MGGCVKCYIKAGHDFITLGKTLIIVGLEHFQSLHLLEIRNNLGILM